MRETETKLNEKSLSEQINAGMTKAEAAKHFGIDEAKLDSTISIDFKRHASKIFSDFRLNLEKKKKLKKAFKKTTLKNPDNIEEAENEEKLSIDKESDARKGEEETFNIEQLKKEREIAINFAIECQKSIKLIQQKKDVEIDKAKNIILSLQEMEKKIESLQRDYLEIIKTLEKYDESEKFEKSKIDGLNGQIEFLEKEIIKKSKIEIMAYKDGKIEFKESSEIVEPESKLNVIELVEKFEFLEDYSYKQLKQFTNLLAIEKKIAENGRTTEIKFESNSIEADYKKLQKDIQG